MEGTYYHGVVVCVAFICSLNLAPSRKRPFIFSSSRSTSGTGGARRR